MRHKIIKNKRILVLAEALVLAGLLAFILVIMTAGSARDIPLPQVEEILAQEEGVTDLIRKDDSGTNSSLGMVPSEYFYYKTNAIMDVRELFVAKAADDREMERIETAIAEHLETQISNFTGYGASQVDLLEHAVSMRKGDYYFFAVGERAQDWQEVFLKQVG